MNRLYQLKKTLPKNIENSSSYDNVEFVVLDYNSKDGLEAWIKSEMADYLHSGVLAYYKTSEPLYFFRSHSKNIAAKMATGEIVCNVDGDNFIGEGFAEYVSEQFLKNKNCYLAVERNSEKKDCYGRICTRKKDFIEITGYDESMTDYGFEDFDLTNRLKLFGKEPQYITNQEYLKVLEHEDASRIENESHIHEIEQIYLRYINHYSTELVYIFKNGTFYCGVVIINRLVNSASIDNIFQENRIHEYINNLKNNAWNQGSWTKNEIGLKLKFEDANVIELIHAENSKMYNKKAIEMVYQPCSDTEILEELIMFLSQIKNRIKMLQNKNEKRIRVNEVFGEVNLTN